jgi:hypothetical protein
MSNVDVINRSTLLHGCNSLRARATSPVRKLARPSFYAGALGRLQCRHAPHDVHFDFMKSDPKLGRAEVLRCAMLA